MSNLQVGKTYTQQEKQQRKGNTLKLQKEPLFPSRKAHEEFPASIDNPATRKARA